MCQPCYHARRQGGEGAQVIFIWGGYGEEGSGPGGIHVVEAGRSLFWPGIGSPLESLEM